MNAISKSLPNSSHDHASCIQKALAMAENICRQRGLRLTKIRRRVLQLVWNSHKPVGAYELLELLSADGQRVAPPTVYRALGFLIEADLVHRLDSLNAFIGCPDPHSSHVGQFLICRDCRSVVELEDSDISDVVDSKAAALGFSAIRQTLEIQGQCPDCHSASPLN